MANGHPPGNHGVHATDGLGVGGRGAPPASAMNSANNETEMAFITVCDSE